MTSLLSTHITHDSFDEQFFNNVFTESPDKINNDMSLLYKSFHLDNFEVFNWAIPKVDWESHLESLLKKFIHKSYFSKYFNALNNYNHKAIVNQKNELLHLFLKNCIWTSGKLKESQLQIINSLIDEGASVTEQDTLMQMLQDPAMHIFLFKLIEVGSKPEHLNNFFSNYCKNGSPKGVEFFKNLGCDVHYLNDLPLKNAAQRHNELMVRHLIDKENADPFVSNYFTFFTLLHEDDYSEAGAISLDMINYLAQLLHKKNDVPTDVMEKLSEYKHFKNTFNYLQINDIVLTKEGKEGKKRTKL